MGAKERIEVSERKERKHREDEVRKTKKKYRHEVMMTTKHSLIGITTTKTATNNLQEEIFRRRQILSPENSPLMIRVAVSNDLRPIY